MIVNLYFNRNSKYKVNDPIITGTVILGFETVLGNSSGVNNVAN
ncbi:hypothetical protein [Bacillus proteolyticus]|nr:hypothetical protein [Bacillus proteolyticus]